MTDKQPEAYAVPLHELLVKVPRNQRLEIEFDKGYGTSYIPVGRYCHEAAAELRRLHEEVQQWQEKCNTYMELHDAVVKDSDRLYAAVANLIRVKGRHNTELAYQRLIAAYDKVKEKNND